MKIETARLIIEPLRDEDFEPFFRLASDAEVMKFIRPPEPREQFRERVNRVKKYASENPGFGGFRVGDPKTDQFLGNAIVRHADFQSGRDIEIGYVLAPEIWGQGFGTEVAGAMADYVLEKLGAEKVVAYISPDHSASERVLKKCGFVAVAEEEIYGGVCLRLEKHKA